MPESSPPRRGADKQITIKHGYPPFKRRIQHTPEILHAMDRVCTAWAKSLGTYATFTIDNRRFAILSELLISQGRTADELGWAILAYADYVQSSDWHRQQGGVHKTFESFLTDPRLEDWLAKGDDFRERRQAAGRKAAETRQNNQRVSEFERLMRRFDLMKSYEKEEILASVAQDYETRQRQGQIYFQRPLTPHSLKSPLLRNLLLKWLQDHDEAKDDTPAAIGRSVDEVLTG